MSTTRDMFNSLRRIQDIVRVVKKECPTYESLLYAIRAKRTAPYSRLAAILRPERTTLKDVCTRGPYEHTYSELGTLYSYILEHNIACVACSMHFITVHRASNEPIKIGDWVYLERARAIEWARQTKSRVQSKVVHTEDVVWAGTSVEEWFYIPKDMNLGSLEAFWAAIRS